MKHFFENINDEFADLSIDSQTFLNNCMGILKLYLDMIFPKKNSMEIVFEDLKICLEDINKYNQELYDCAVQDKAVSRILDYRRTNSEKHFDKGGIR